MSLLHPKPVVNLNPNYSAEQIEQAVKFCLEWVDIFKDRCSMPSIYKPFDKNLHQTLIDWRVESLERFSKYIDQYSNQLSIPFIKLMKNNLRVIYNTWLIASDEADKVIPLVW